MILIWDILKKTVLFGWEEIIYLVVYNVLTLVALMAGPSLVVTGVNMSSAGLMLLGSALMFAIPPALFGLFWLTYQISLENAVKFSTYFDGAKQHPKPMVIWGGINLLVVVTLISNIIFYQSLETTWAGYAGIFFYALFIVWIILQLLMLAMYPHLEIPSFRLAMKNSLKLLAINPFAIIGMAVIIIAEIALGGYFTVVLGIISVSLAALVANVTVGELIAAMRKEK